VGIDPAFCIREGNMNLNKIILALAVGGLLLPVVHATEAVVNTTVTAEIAPAEIKQSDEDVTLVKAGVDTLDLIESKLKNYVANLKRSLEKNNKAHKAFVYSGSAEISVDKSNPNWAKFRERALGTAILNARKSYLETLNTSVENSTIAMLSYNNGLPAPTVSDFKSDSKLSSFVDKVVAVLDGKLDKDLKEMGIDPKQYNAAPPAIKRDLYKNAVVDQTFRSSYGDLSGMMLVKVYEEITESGQGTVGAVMVLSAKKRDQIKALVESNGQVGPDESRKNPKYSSIHDALVAQQDSLYLKSGTQIVYDAQGYPMIFAYGQSGVTYSASSIKRKIERKVAKGFAVNNAWANFSRTYNLSGDFSSKSSISQSSSETEKFELIADSVRSQSSGLTESLVEQMEEKASMHSSLQSMTGVSTEFDWRRKHPVTGQEMIGTVLVWHPKKIINAQNLADGKTETELDFEQNSDSTSSKGFESEDMFDAADF